jgi:hypothetical protein
MSRIRDRKTITAPVKLPRMDYEGLDRAHKQDHWDENEQYHYEVGFEAAMFIVQRELFKRRIAYKVVE